MGSIKERKVLDTVIGKFRIVAKESAEDPPSGVIIDVYAANAEGDDIEPLESYTLWYDDYWEEK